jgi:hypothetical protein
MVLRALHEHSTDEPIELIEPLIHPDAEMRLLVSHGELLRGRQEIVKALEYGRAAETFRALVRRFEWLDDSTSLTSAHARYALAGGGMAEGQVFWLDELRDGMIWRVRVFKSDADARDTYERERA